MIHLYHVTPADTFTPEQAASPGRQAAGLAHLRLGLVSAQSLYVPAATERE